MVTWLFICRLAGFLMSPLSKGICTIISRSRFSFAFVDEKGIVYILYALYISNNMALYSQKF